MCRLVNCNGIINLGFRKKNDLPSVPLNLSLELLREDVIVLTFPLDNPIERLVSESCLLSV